MFEDSIERFQSRQIICNVSMSETNCVIRPDAAIQRDRRGLVTECKVDRYLELLALEHLVQEVLPVSEAQYVECVDVRIRLRLDPLIFRQLLVFYVVHWQCRCGLG